MFFAHVKVTVKTNSRFGELYTCFGRETKTRMVRILVIFQDRPMFSHIIQRSRRELSIDVAENIGLCRKITKIRLNPVLVLYPKQV